jgi:hypothetical protein
MRQKELLEAKREDILHLAKQYGACNVRVFGNENELIQIWVIRHLLKLI